VGGKHLTLLFQEKINQGSEATHATTKKNLVTSHVSLEAMQFQNMAEYHQDRYVLLFKIQIYSLCI
jgi:hypothetical protein